MPKYSIEARYYDVPEFSVSHHYWLLRDLATGQPIAELHGLITDRASGAPLQLGIDARGGHALQVWHFIHAPAEGLWMAPERTEFNDSALYWEGQKALSMFAGEAEEALTRWNSAAATLPLLNRGDLEFPAEPGAAPDDNSVYATLGEIMGVEAHLFSGSDAPGLELRLLDAAQIESLRFRPGGRVAVADPDIPAWDAPAVDAEAAAPARVRTSGPIDPTDSEHPDHALYRQSLAAVHALDASLGRTPDEASERLAASMLVVAKQAGMDRIDHVILSVRTDYVGRGQNVFVVQNDYRSWAHRRAHTDTHSAVATSAAESFGKLAAFGRR